MPTYNLGSSPLVHAPGLVAWAINAYAFPRDRDVTLHVVTETWPGFPAEHARLLLARSLQYTVDGGVNRPGVRAMTEYIAKLRFWLRCWDSMDIEAENDEEAVRIACDAAREMMQLVSFPESIETDERREGLISYIDRVDTQERTEIAEAIEFHGMRRLFPETDDLIVRLAGLHTGDLAGEAELRAVLDDIVAQARRISPVVSPLADPTG